MKWTHKKNFNYNLEQLLEAKKLRLHFRDSLLEDFKKYNQEQKIIQKRISSESCILDKEERKQKKQQFSRLMSKDKNNYIQSGPILLLSDWTLHFSI